MSNSGVEKNSPKVMFKPSQIFLTVDTVVLLLRPLTILLIVDCVMPQIVHNLFTEMSRSWHKLKMRFFTAVLMFTVVPPISH